jgi:hypothetical protein
LYLGGLQAFVNEQLWFTPYYEFIKYVEDQKIKLYNLPPHIIHFLQLLDIGYFQSLKWHYDQALDLAVKIGASKFNKTELLHCILFNHKYLREGQF